MRRSFMLMLVIWFCASGLYGFAIRQDEDDQDGPSRPPITRSKRPEFTQREVDALFFRDLFTEALVGERPDNFDQFAGTGTTNTGDGGGNGETESGLGAGGEYGWSSVIIPEALEYEVKRLNAELEQAVTTPRRFESGEYRLARLHFSVLAMLFAIISEYDQDVKWRDDAAAARELFSAMAANATAGSNNVYQQAKLRREDLRDLVNGGSVEAAGDIDPAPDWEWVVDRPPLMDRLDIGYNDSLKGWVSSPSEFRANKDELAMEAYLIAAIAEVLTRQGMPDAEESGYVDYAVEMRDAALEIIAAIDANDADRAAVAGSLIFQACQNCHGEWQ